MALVGAGVMVFPPGPLPPPRPPPHRWQAVGARIRAERLARGMTQAELGAHLGVREWTVGKWETGRQSPRWSALHQLAEVLAIPHAELDMLAGYPVARDGGPSAGAP